LQAGMQSLVDKVDDLIQSLNHLPLNKHTTVTTSYETEGTPPPQEDDTSDSERPAHAYGGVFKTEHVARIAEAGRPEIVGDIPFMTKALQGALLQVRDVMQPSDFAPMMKDLSQVMTKMDQTVKDVVAQPGETTNLTITIQTLDSDNVETAVERKILPALTKVLSNGRGLSDLRRVLG
jgi:SLT domain-containing protein